MSASSASSVTISPRTETPGRVVPHRPERAHVVAHGRLGGAAKVQLTPSRVVAERERERKHTKHSPQASKAARAVTVKAIDTLQYNGGQCGCGVGKSPAGQRAMQKKAVQWEAGCSFVCCMCLIIVPSVTVLAAVDLPTGTSGRVGGYLWAATIVCTFFLVVYFVWMYRRCARGDVAVPSLAELVRHGGRGGDAVAQVDAVAAPTTPSPGGPSKYVDQSTWLHVDRSNPNSIASTDKVLPMWMCALCETKLTDSCGLCSQATARGAPIRSACTMVTGLCGHAYHFHCISANLAEQQLAGATRADRECPLDHLNWRFRSSLHEKRHGIETGLTTAP